MSEGISKTKHQARKKKTEAGKQYERKESNLKTQPSHMPVNTDNNHNTEKRGTTEKKGGKEKTGLDCVSRPAIFSKQHSQIMLVKERTKGKTRRRKEKTRRIQTATPYLLLSRTTLTGVF